MSRDLFTNPIIRVSGGVHWEKYLFFADKSICYVYLVSRLNKE